MKQTLFTYMYPLFAFSATSVSALHSGNAEFILFYDDFKDPYSYTWDVSGPYWSYYGDEYLREYFIEGDTAGLGDVISSSGYISYVAYATDTLTSPDDIYIPAFTDSLFVECSMSYYAYCAAIGILFDPWTHAELYALTEANEPVLIWEFYGDAKWDNSREAVSWYWEETIEASVPSDIWSCGELIAFRMIGTCHAEGAYDAAVSIDWKLDDFFIWGLSSSRLERLTWGSIKNSF